MSDTVVSPAGHARPLTVCVVAHTHWDREWYHEASRFRQALVALVDGLLANATGATAPFLLDGQTIVLEDYLAVRPERAAQVGALLREGALEAGPWYVLGDGLIPSGEALVRNLLVGRGILRQFGIDVKAPAVAYGPDTFGHAGAIPFIAHGFGLPIAVVWRGYGGARAPRGDVVRWQRDDGSEVLLYHLPPDGYETGSALPTDRDAMHARWAVLKPLLAARANTGIVLLPNGADHHALQPGLTPALLSLQAVAEPDVIIRTSLAGFAERLVTAAQQHELPIVTGELRDSYGYAWMLGGTYGTRAHQKRANARAERALLRDVEPWLVLAWLHGATTLSAVAVDSSITLAQAPALLTAAWQTLLRAHPHDTLCGCSIDAVARAMDQRVASARAQARGLRSAALDMAYRHDVVGARGQALSSRASVLVRNRVARWRSGVAEVSLDETLADAPVGPSSAGVTGNSTSVAEGTAVKLPTIGNLTVQVLDSRLVYRRRESPQHYPDNDLVREYRALVWMPPVPPLGLAARAFAFVADAQESNEVRSALKPEAGNESIKVPGAFDKEITVAGASKPGAFERTSSSVLNEPSHGEETMSQLSFTPSTGAVTVDGIELANGHVTVSVSKAGVRLVKGERVIANALTFESCSDVGDSYTPAIRGNAEPLNVVRFERTAVGPLRSSVRVWYATSGKSKAVRLRATLSLDAGSETLRIAIRGDNRRRNHRLRVSFHTDVTRDVRDTSRIDVWADAAFGPVLRAPLNVPAHDQVFETVPPTMPMHRWATLTSRHRAATLHSDGLAEVEANAADGVLSLTLLRAIGELSRNNLAERPGHAGWPARIPLAQSQGSFRARIGLHLHDAWSQQARVDIENASDALLLPLTGYTMRDLEREHFDLSGPGLTGAGLRQSTVMLADDGDGFVLRCVNDSPEPRQGRWTVPDVAAMQFAMARLDETVTGNWQPIDGIIAFTAPPRGVVTIRVRRHVP